MSVELLLGKAGRIVRGSVYPRWQNIRTSEAAPVKRGDRQPVRQSLVVSQRQCFGLVVYLPLHRFITSY